jgi:hypothetical protein
VAPLPRPFAFKRWLLLVLGVLLAHAALLQLIPLAPTTNPPLAQASMVFETRSIAMVSPMAPVNAAPPLKAPKPANRPPRPQPTAAAVTPAADPSPNLSGEPVAGALTSHRTEPQAAAPEPEPAPRPTADSAPVDVALADKPAEPASAAAPAQEKPYHFDASKLSTSTRLMYNLKTNKFPFSLNAELLWRNLGASYSARLSYSAFGLTRMQTSRGQVTPVGLAPERFADKYKSEVAAHFNYAGGKITFSANTPDAVLLPGAQDRLSVLMQLGALLASDPERFKTGTTVALQTVGPRAADIWLFTVGESESLAMPGGTVSGLKLERNPRDLYDQKVEVWLSPQLNYLPARIRITETNGDSADQQWASTEPAEGAD